MKRTKEQQRLRNAEQRWLGIRHMENYIYVKSRGRCELCKGRYHRTAMVFHHLDPTQKESHLAVQEWRGIYGPPERTIEEADKCAVLCANCHAMEHQALREGWSLLQQQEEQNESPGRTK